MKWSKKESSIKKMKSTTSKQAHKTHFLSYYFIFKANLGKIKASVMDLKILILIILFFLNLFSSFSQEVEVLKKNDSIPQIKEKGLAYINPKTNISDYHFIVRVKIKSNDFNTILSKLQRVSIDWNANAFRLVTKELLNNKTSIIVDLYAASPELIAINASFNESNVIYFFGNDHKKQKFKINNAKIVLNPEQIHRYEIPEKSQIKINIGGIMGETIYHRWKENQPVIFYALGSGNLSTSGNGYSNVYLHINTRKMIELKTDFAKLLMDLKK